MSRKEALERYRLSDEEFEEWVRAAGRYGVDALKATNVQKYRQP